jgi:hypothetical protein
MITPHKRGQASFVGFFFFLLGVATATYFVLYHLPQDFQIEQPGDLDTLYPVEGLK